MLDIHCHILPGVDDGARSLDESLAMARFCVADGITCVIATPHCHRHCRLLRADILPHVARLHDALIAADIPLSVLPGSEIQVTDTTAYRREFDAGLYCHLGNRPAFTLLEFNWKPEQYPTDATELIGWLRERGTTPIIAHPERHGFFADEPVGVGGQGSGPSRRTGEVAGVGRGRGVDSGDGRFATWQSRAGPAGSRRGVAPVVPERGAGNRRSQPEALLRAIGRVYLGPGTSRSGASGEVAGRGGSGTRRRGSRCLCRRCSGPRRHIAFSGFILLPAAAAGERVRSASEAPRSVFPE